MNNQRQGSEQAIEEDIPFKHVPVTEILKKQSLPFGYCAFGKRIKKSNKQLTFTDGGNCLGWRPAPEKPYIWLTYQQVLDRAQHFGSGLIAEGAKANNSQFIGIFSQNRVEWKITEQACNSFSMVIVPLYDTLGAHYIEHIINHCELNILVVDDDAKAHDILSAVKLKLFRLKLLIIVESPKEKTISLGRVAKVKLMTFAQLEERGKSHKKSFVPPSPGDLNTICFTSGTTGVPKGAMLTHKNFIANQAGIFCIGQDSFLAMDNTDVHISYLPLAHVFERIVQVQVFYCGASIGFFQGDIKLLLNDMVYLKPTILLMVPRLINRLYDKVCDAASTSFIKRLLLPKAVKQKTANLKRGIVSQNTIWDFLVFRKFRNMLGGRVRLCITGSAPISLEVITFMRVALGIPFTEGYGQTEATAAISITLPGDYESGSVGTVAACNLVKLVDVPDKKYFVKDGKGEICAKGPNIFRGYYKDPITTKQVLDEEGWLHTGDIGMWLPNGALKIIDRKKHIFKLSHGEYITPEKIEGTLVQSKAVAQIYVYGDSLKSTLMAVVVPEEANFVSWCLRKGLSGNYQTLCCSGKANELVLVDLRRIGERCGLQIFELPQKIFLSSESFTVKNGLLTPTFKSRRQQIYKRYEAEIKEMYKNVI